LLGDSFSDDDRLLRYRGSSDVHGRVPAMTDTVNSTEQFYRVVMRTGPGRALFEATVRRLLTAGGDDAGDRTKFDVDWRQISRINRYDRQPHCVMDSYPHLRPYCYCFTQEYSAPDNTSVILDGT